MNEVLTGAYLVILCALAIALAARDVTVAPLNGDETVTYRIALMPWSAAWSTAVADLPHPPMFTMLLKLWITLGGSSLLWVRLLPTVAACLTLIPFFLLVAEFQIPRGTAALALGAVLANETRMYYTHIVRNYGMLMLLSVFSIWLFARNTRTKDVPIWQTGAYFLVNLFMCWMHYFGAWVIIVEFLLALAFYRKEIKRTLLTGIIIAASFLLWVPSALHFASSNNGLNGFIGWMERPSLASLAWFYHNLIGAPDFPHFVPIGFVLFGLPLCAWCIRAVVAKPGDLPGKQRLLVHLLPQVTLPVLGTFALSLFGPLHVFAARVLIFVIIPYCLLIAAGVAEIPWRIPRGLIIAALAAWTICAIFQSASAMANFDVRWDTIAGCVANSSSAALPVLTPERFIKLPYTMYLQMSGKPANQVAEIPGFSASLPTRFWAGYRDFRDRPDYARELARDLQAAGYKPVSSCSIPGGTRDSFRVIFDLEARDNPRPSF